MTLTIRRATPADAPIIVDFNCRLAEESESKILDRRQLIPGVAGVLADENKGLYFLAVDDGQIVGQLMITREWSDWRNGWFWWIQSVYVRADHRRTGVFRRLYQHVADLARADPEVIGIRLYVDRENQRAQRTYRRMGMSATTYLVLERYPL